MSQADASHPTVTGSSSTSGSKPGSTEMTHHGDAPTWLAALAKAGYAARGFIYIVIGTMALLKAFGQGGETGGSKDALAKLLEAPGGQILLWLMAVGLVGYSVWRFIQAVMDADNHGTDGKGLVIRAGLLVSSVTHILLAFYAGYLAYKQTDDSSGGSGSEGMVAKIMGWPAGPWIVGFIGLCIIGAGVAHALKAHKEKFKKRFVIEHDKMEKIEPICKFGLYARSVVFAIIGGMFLWAAFTQDSDNAGGLNEVLDKISQQSYGMVLLAIMAAGLFAFGLYSVFEAVYRKVDGPD